MSVPDVKFITDEDRNVCIGGQYKGDTVTKLDEEVTDLGGRIRTRKMITVKSGIIYKLDLFVDKQPDRIEKKVQVKEEKRSIPTKKNSIPTKQTSKDTILSILSTTSTVKTSGGGLSSAQSVPDESPPSSPPPPSAVNIRDVPKEFENGKSVPVTVFPKSDLDKNIGGTTGGAAVGEWRYPKGQEVKDDHFLPQEIDLYYGNDEPLFPSGDGAYKDDDESSMSSFGLWGLDAGDDAPHQSWTRSSRNICFPPGMEPSDDVDILGRWVYSPENKYTGTGENKWPPPTTKSAWVFPKKDKYDEDFDPLVPSQGVWKSKDNSFEDVNWQPQQVDLYNNDDDSSTSDDFDEALPHGCWGIKEGAKPDPDTNKFPPNQLWFYPPGEEPEPDCIVKGRWCMSNNNTGGRSVGKLNVTWPPPETNVGIGSTFHGSISSSGSSESVEIPVLFENGKVPIKVFPKSSFPQKSDSDTSGSKSKKKVRFDLIGQWSYPDGQEEDDDHWMPQAVDLYLGDNEPPYPQSEESSISSYGLWGTRRSGTPTRLNSNTSLSSGSISLSLSLDWTPEGSLVFPPGVEPDEEDDVEIHGKWAYPRLGHDDAVKIEWPPPMAESAWVFPESNVPGVDNNESRGIWRFNNEDKNDSHRQWQAKKVQLYTIDKNMGDDEKADPSKVWGKWGIRRGAEPDEKWNWNPKDLWFYPPNEEPEKDCMVQGSWATDLKTWPPPTRKIGRSLREVGKLEIPAIESNLASPRASVGKLTSPQSRSSSAGGKSVGKLKIPTTFGDAASPEQRRKVAKLKFPDNFL